MPSVRILDNVQLDANTYVVKREGGRRRPGPGLSRPVHGDRPHGRAGSSFPASTRIEPTFGLPATWLDASLRDEAQLRGYTVVDAATVISTHLTEILKANVGELLSYVELQKLLKELPKEHTELVKDIVPAQIADDRHPARAAAAARRARLDPRPRHDPGGHRGGGRHVTKNPRDIAEIVRQRLARQICAQYTRAAGPASDHHAVAALGDAPSPSRSSARATSATSPCSPRKLHGVRHPRCATASRRRRARARCRCSSPRPVVRPFVRSIIERFRRETPVMSQAEIHPRVRLKTVGSV